MPRARRPFRLTLLLAVAPLVSACGGEGRHCVGPDGVYVADGCCEPGAGCNVPGSHWVYVPHHHYTGVGSHAGAYRSATSPSRGGASGVARGGFGGHGGGAHAGGG